MSGHRSPDMDVVNNSKSRARSGKARRFTPIRWKDYTFEPEAEDWLIHDLLPREGVAVVYGKWKSFKSFVALDVGVAIARSDRRLWAGRATRQGTVIYICCEGAHGMRKRIEAYKLKHELQDLDFYVIAARPALGTQNGDAKALIGAIRSALGEDQPVLVIIDTLARTLAGKDENGEGMRNFIDGAEDVADAFHCLVLAVHHEGAGEKDRMRGNTALDAASVATWHVKKSSNGTLGCTVTIQEAKDSTSGETLQVTLQRFVLGDEHDDERHSTLTVENIESGDALTTAHPSKSRDSVARDLRVLMTSFSIALDDHGEQVQLPNNGPKVRAVNIEKVRPIYYAKRGDLDNQDSKKKAFSRDLKRAITCEAVLSGEIDGAALLWQAIKK
jgi:hypothetical protein